MTVEQRPGAAAATADGSRVARAVRAANDAGRAALVVYLPAGYPDLDTSRTCLEAAAEAGADLLEVGFPYSDPLMDGPVIQAACQAALDWGYTPADDLAMCAALTAAVEAPALVMTYYNLAWRYGGPGRLDAFAADAAAAGLVGAILPDLPADEGGPWTAAAAAHGLATVFLAAPTSTAERLAAVAGASTGFVYATSTLGVTGERSSLAATAAPLVERLRACTDRPVCVGIGVSAPEQAAEVAGFADGVIVGSAAVRAAGEGGPDAVRRLVAALAEGCRLR
ncbi:MAG TPA: tryptophan synthase subunit alpha [Egibacteraceae bacterium]|nr:tryptophan synthase subunit alpha [Egibacteraceae bacterium]